MKTLREIIDWRQQKSSYHSQGLPSGSWWEGYYEGWRWAYQDLKEILEQNSFDMDVIVVHDKPCGNERGGADHE